MQEEEKAARGGCRDLGCSVGKDSSLGCECSTPLLSCSPGFRPVPDSFPGANRGFAG